MGRSYICANRVEITSNVSGFSSFGWNSKINGRVSNANAERYRVAMNQSFQPGGHNEHLTKAHGVVPHISKLVIIAQTGKRAGEVVAEANAPMFEVV